MWKRKVNVIKGEDVGEERNFSEEVSCVDRRD